MESEYLNEIEKEKITTLLGDVVLKEALRKVFLKRIYDDGILKAGVAAKPYENFALNVYKNTEEMYSDEELGRVTKVRRLAIELVQTGFEELERYKKAEVSKGKVINKAR